MKEFLVADMLSPMSIHILQVSFIIFAKTFLKIN